VTTVRRWSGLARWQWAASEIRLVVGGFDHGGHGLHHGGTTSMDAGRIWAPRVLDPGAAVFLFLKIGLSNWLGTTNT
jgi:hypothetical protein